ncbi:uncharacterized protein LOC135163580 [Diachasmimorpha longicaudata]|uniref:uncharacterized protein LOC135163580 n=1 Tax=Diachasmimorpha longicaudata TaxID=58733 RepID=UPI0030B8F0D4
MEGILAILLFSLTLASASKCPEARKPHVTGCSIYYECINLPEGGYVWAPAKCPEGLMFQPYLRLCVLPGDSWACVEHSTHASTNLKTPELLDETKTSYHELNPHYFNSPEYLNLGNFVSTIPHPLIEVENLNEKENHVQGSQKLPNNIKAMGTNGVENVNGFSQVIFYRYPGSAPSSPVIDASNNEFIVQFIRNYVFNHTINSRGDRKRMKNSSSTTERINDPGDGPEVTATSDIPPKDELIDEANNVIAIIGNLGNREYVTTEKYKSLSTQMKIEVIEVVPCITGIRLPNATNCMKYYMCEPKTAEVYDFTCPQNTAFNAQINLCDHRKHISCKKITEGLHVEKLILVQEKGDPTREDNPCEKTGKYADKNSAKFYYLCYTDEHSEKIKSVKLSCPNNLMFCEKKKACVSKRFCYAVE